MKKTTAVIIELIPVVSAVLFFALLRMHADNTFTSIMSVVTLILAFFGFVFFFIGRRLAKGDKAVRILGILDWLSTVSIIGLYALVFYALGS
jgi:hypothetical protein